MHFSKILSELSKLQVVLDEDEYIFSFADPNLMKYPFAYMCEVGYMQLTDEEIAGMREYLLAADFCWWTISEAGRCGLFNIT